MAGKFLPGANQDVNAIRRDRPVRRDCMRKIGGECRRARAFHSTIKNNPGALELAARLIKNDGQVPGEDLIARF